MAYSDGDVREAVEEQGAELLAKVPPVTNAARFPKTDFDVNTQAGAVTCPAGVTTTTAKKAKDHKGRPGLTFNFPASPKMLVPIPRQTSPTAMRPRFVA